jgi:hypothetical protein
VTLTGNVKDLVGNCSTPQRKEELEVEERLRKSGLQADMDKPEP